MSTACISHLQPLTLCVFLSPHLSRVPPTIPHVWHCISVRMLCPTLLVLSSAGRVSSSHTAPLRSRCRARLDTMAQLYIESPLCGAKPHTNHASVWASGHHSDLYSPTTLNKITHIHLRDLMACAACNHQPKTAGELAVFAGDSKHFTRVMFLCRYRCRLYFCEVVDMS